LPLLRELMVATMCGVKQGWLRRSLPVSKHVLALGAGEARD
jgi:hypothetical protein